MCYRDFRNCKIANNELVLLLLYPLPTALNAALYFGEVKVYFPTLHSEFLTTMHFEK